MQADQMARLAPPLFVLLWSTGFIGAKMGLPHAEPWMFLAQRFWLVALILLLWRWISRAPWPAGRQWRDAALVGLLMNAAYLGAVYVAIDRGLEAGLAALITSLQPIATGLLAAVMLGEPFTGRKWLGLALGVLGVTLVVWPKLGVGTGGLAAVAICALSLVAIAFGSIHQKRHGGAIPVRSGAAVQFIASAVACTILSLIFDTGETTWTGEFIFALLWLVVVLSLGALSLLYFMIRRGAASEVASLFFLVPPATAVIAWALFDETIGPLGLLGFALTAIAVWLVMRKNSG